MLCLFTQKPGLIPGHSPTALARCTATKPRHSKLSSSGPPPIARRARGPRHARHVQAHPAAQRGLALERGRRGRQQRVGHRPGHAHHPLGAGIPTCSPGRASRAALLIPIQASLPAAGTGVLIICYLLVNISALGRGASTVITPPATLALDTCQHPIQMLASLTRHMCRASLRLQRHRIHMDAKDKRLQS